MSLAAEDDADRSYAHPSFSMRLSRVRPRQPLFQLGTNVCPREARELQLQLGATAHQQDGSSSDPMANIAHTALLGNGAAATQSLMALMADFESSRAVSAGSMAAGSGQQDMSYEALTTLEDVKLTAPPELLASMPLDMHLKGGQWEDMVLALSNMCTCSHAQHNILDNVHYHDAYFASVFQVLDHPIIGQDTAAAGTTVLLIAMLCLFTSDKGSLACRFVQYASLSTSLRRSL